MSQIICPLCRVAVTCICCFAADAATAYAGALVTFGDGMEGWTTSPSWHNEIDASTPALHMDYPVADGLGLYNSTNQAFLGDYTRSHSLRLGLDVNTLGIQDNRELLVVLTGRSSHNTLVSVSYQLGTLEANESSWQTWSVIINDTSATALPIGWHTGSYDPGVPPTTLPSGTTFSQVIANIDSIKFTTFVPGYAYFENSFDVLFRNIFMEEITQFPVKQNYSPEFLRSISQESGSNSLRALSVPEPSTFALAALGALGLLFADRRKQ